MIILTRLGGSSLAVNPDLIERAEATPDTVITLVDGHKLVVADSMDDVVHAVRTWRASIAAEAYLAAADVERLDRGAPGEEPDELGEPGELGERHGAVRSEPSDDAGHLRDARRRTGTGLAAALASHPMARVLPIARKES